MKDKPTDNPEPMALERQKERPLAVQAPDMTELLEKNPVAAVGLMLAGCLDKGVTTDNVAAVKELTALFERMEDRKAEKLFAAAFNALQSDMPAVKAMAEVPDRDGAVRYTYAPYEAIMDQVRPYLLKHGFTVAFDTLFDQGVVTITCKLQHVGGHMKETKFGAHVGQGPPKASPAQADGAAATYAKRFALCNALNIVIEKDNDARAKAVEPVDPKEAEKLRQRVHNTGTPETEFLMYFGVKKFEDFPLERWAEADRILRKREKTT